MRKVIFRSRLIVTNSLRIFFPALFNFIVAYFVINYHSAVLWGQVVNYIIFVTLSTQVIAWGNYEYLLRAFSRNSANMSKVFQEVFLARFPLLIFPIGIAFFAFPKYLFPWIVLWLISAMLFQSFQVAIVYLKRFVSAAIIEVIAMATALIYLWTFRATINEKYTIIAFLIFAAIKAIFLLILYRSNLLKKNSTSIKFSYLQTAAPFLIIALAGMLNSKADLYIVNFFLEDEAVARYQLFINSFLYLKIAASMLIMPFSKNIYRLPDDKVKKLLQRFTAFGVCFASVGGIAIYFALSLIYKIELSVDYFFYGVLFVLPSFCLEPLIYKLYWHKKEKMVMTINFVGIVINVLLTAWLIQVMSIKGAIIATLVAHWVMVLLFYVLGSRIKK